MLGEEWTMMRVPAQPERLHALRGLVRDQAFSHGFTPDVVDELVLAVNEACMNVIQHGYRGTAGVLELGVRADAAGVEFRIRDQAPMVSLEDWQPRDLDDLRPGGLGVHFIRQIMDEIRYLPPPEGVGNWLSMKKYLPTQENVT